MKVYSSQVRGLEGDGFGSSVGLMPGIPWRAGRCYLRFIPEQKEGLMPPAVSAGKAKASPELA